MYVASNEPHPFTAQVIKRKWRTSEKSNLTTLTTPRLIMGCTWSPADPHLTILTLERDRAGREVAVPSAIHVIMTKLCMTSCYFFNSVSYREHVLESRGSTQSVSYWDLQASCGSKRCRCDRQCLIPPL